MIHILEVTPDLTLKQLSRLSRRYGMTGGFELAIPDTLSSEELVRLYEVYSAELKKFSPGNSLYRSNNAFRILNLIAGHQSCSQELARNCERDLAVGDSRIDSTKL